MQILPISTNSYSKNLYSNKNVSFSSNKMIRKSMLTGLASLLGVDIIIKNQDNTNNNVLKEQKQNNVEKIIPLTEQEKTIIIQRMPLINGYIPEYDYIKQMIGEEEENRRHTWPESMSGLYGGYKEKYEKYVGSYKKSGTFTIDDYCNENRHLLNQ